MTNNLLQLIQKAGFKSQTEFGRALGMMHESNGTVQTTVYRWCKNGQRLPTKHIPRACYLLNCKPEDFQTYETYEPPTS